MKIGVLAAGSVNPNFGDTKLSFSIRLGVTTIASDYWATAYDA